MTRATVLQELRQMRFEELCELRQRRTLTMAEAAEILGITERTFRHWSGRYTTEGRRGCRTGGSSEPRIALYQWMMP
jgi:transposase